MQDPTRNTYPVDYANVVITKGDPATDLSLGGYVREHPDYHFAAKVYDRAGECGIGSGRISELTVWHRGEEIMNYSRGWDLRPSAPEHLDIMVKICAAFPQPSVEQYREFKRAQRELLAARDASDREAANLPQTRDLLQEPASQRPDQIIDTASQKRMTNPYWVAKDGELTLHVNGRARALANPLINGAEIYPEPRSLWRDVETIVLPLGELILDQVEARLGLTAPAPIFDERGAPASGLREQIEKDARHFREKLYLQTDRPGQVVIELLHEAHADLNKAATDRTLSAAANEARFHCAAALRVLEADQQTEGQYRFPPGAVEAIRNAIAAIRQDDPPPGGSFIPAFPADVFAARLRCMHALEYVEKNLHDTEPARPCRRPPREPDPDRER